MIKNKASELIRRIQHFSKNRLFEEDNNSDLEVNNLGKENSMSPYTGNNIYKPMFEDGHFYSTIPSEDDINTFVRKQGGKANLQGISLFPEKQTNLILRFKKYYKDLPFTDERKKGLRYFYKNPNFSYGDAISLYSFIRMLKPKRIIEIGSGYSSCVQMDTNEIFFKNKINITFIEPYPDLLLNLMKKQDKKKYKIVDKRIQDVHIDIFKELDKNDILFIDTTHVSKIGSDVNHIFFNILPSLKKGVHIHIHDIFYPFEYPIGWIKQGIFWNENYLLHAFLINNKKFRIEFFNNYLWEKHRRILVKHLPLYNNNPGGSIWLLKL